MDIAKYSEKLNKVLKNVEQLLRENPQLRSLKKRKEFIWEYYKKYENLKFGITKELWLYHLTNPETISRAVRKCQKENPDLKASEEDEKEKRKQSKIFSNFYKKAEENKKEIKELTKELTNAV